MSPNHMPMLSSGYSTAFWSFISLAPPGWTLLRERDPDLIGFSALYPIGRFNVGKLRRRLETRRLLLPSVESATMPRLFYILALGLLPHPKIGLYRLGYVNRRGSQLSWIDIAMLAASTHLASLTVPDFFQ